jgi:hypothetical protein
VDNTGKEHYEIKEFGTFTDDLVEMKNWLLNNKCPALAMESTGVYWRPVHKGRLKNKITFLMGSICSSNQPVVGVSLS